MIAWRLIKPWSKNLNSVFFGFSTDFKTFEFLYQFLSVFDSCKMSDIFGLFSRTSKLLWEEIDLSRGLSSLLTLIDISELNDFIFNWQAANWIISRRFCYSTYRRNWFMIFGVMPSIYNITKLNYLLKFGILSPSILLSKIFAFELL